MKQRPRYFIYFHLLLLAGACLRRAVDIRSKNKSKKHKRGGGSDDEEKRGLYIETAEDEGIRKEGEKACSTRVSLIAFISKRGVRPLWYHHGLYSSQKQRQHREHTPGPDLFLSSIILFYFLARPPLLGPQLPFDVSPSPRDVDSFLFTSRCPLLHSTFYISSSFFFMRFSFPLLQPTIGIIIDVSGIATHATILLQSNQSNSSSRWIYSSLFFVF